MQREHRDHNVRVLGMACKDELEDVENFLVDWAPKMEYALAFDKEDATSDAYGVRGIPQSVVIGKDGRIAWMGHPMGALDSVLERMLAGTYDVDRARDVSRVEKELATARRAEDHATALALIEKLVTLEPDNVVRRMQQAYALRDAQRAPAEMESLVRSVLEDFSDDPIALASFANRCLIEGPASEHRALADPALQAAFEAAPGEVEVGIAYFCSLAARGEGDRAVAAAERALGAIGEAPADMGRFARVLAQRKGHAGCVDLALRVAGEVIELEPEALGHRYLQFDILNESKGDVAAATRAGHAIIALARPDTGALNNFAWGLLTDEGKAGKFDPLALSAAEAMAALADGRRPYQLDTLALAYFENGLIDSAIATQTQAIEQLTDEDAVKEYSQRLDQFKQAKAAASGG